MKFSPAFLAENGFSASETGTGSPLVALETCGGARARDAADADACATSLKLSACIPPTCDLVLPPMKLGPDASDVLCIVQKQLTEETYERLDDYKTRR